MTHSLKKTTKPIAMLIALVSLQGCDGMRSSLGLDHHQVNPYGINECDAPLTIPDLYTDTLPVPRRQGEGDISGKKITQHNPLYQHQPKMSSSSSMSLEKQLETSIKNTHSIEKNIRTTVDKEAKDDQSTMSRAARRVQQWREEFRQNLLNKRPKTVHSENKSSSPHK
jgi:hypothetical protein